MVLKHPCYHAAIVTFSLDTQAALIAVMLQLVAPLVSDIYLMSLIVELRINEIAVFNVKRQSRFWMLACIHNDIDMFTLTVTY